MLWTEQKTEVSSAMMTMENAVGMRLYLSENSSFGRNTRGLKLTVRTGTELVFEKDLSLETLQAMTQRQQIYTSVNGDRKPEVTLAEGILLSDLIAITGADEADITNLRFLTGTAWTAAFQKSFYWTVPGIGIHGSLMHGTPLRESRAAGPRQALSQWSRFWRCALIQKGAPQRTGAG